MFILCKRHCAVNSCLAVFSKHCVSDELYSRCPTGLLHPHTCRRPPKEILLQKNVTEIFL